MSPETLALLQRADLHAALAAGAVAAGLAVAEHRVAGRIGRGAWFDPGLLIALALFVVLRRADRAPVGAPRGWALGVVVAGAGVAPLLLASARALDPRATLGCLVLAATGLFYAVPDTEEALLLLGVTLPFALAAPFGPPLRPVGAAAFAVAFAWVAATGGRARPGSAIAALACLGLLLIGWRARPALPVRELLGVQLLIVFVAARVLPQEPPGVTAVLAAAWLLVVARFTRGPANVASAPDGL